MSPGTSEPRPPLTDTAEPWAGPRPSGTRTPLLTDINPEAGHHSFPDDPREIEAAVRAGERCWGQFPYLQQRYGERGLRFSRSDAAWKATLYRLEPEQIIEQARWLGRVLAARGMPTVILQSTLQMLVEELSRSVPERRSEYAKLIGASTDLVTSRRKHLTDGQMQALSDDFERAVGAAASAELPQVGHLIGCAVADEMEGFEGATASLLAWLADPERFPAAWVDAVESTLKRASELARVNRAPVMPTGQP